MESDGMTALESPITTYPLSIRLGMRAPKLLLGHARSHINDSRVAVSEDEALDGKGWLR